MSGVTEAMTGFQIFKRETWPMPTHLESLVQVFAAQASLNCPIVPHMSVKYLEEGYYCFAYFISFSAILQMIKLRSGSVPAPLSSQGRLHQARTIKPALYKPAFRNICSI